MRFNKTYFILASVLFVSEVLIALFVRDSFVRPYVGDFLVVILIYFTIQAFFKVSIAKACIGVLLFSYGIEILQYFRWVHRLGLDGNVIAKTIMGYGFEWKDLVAYTLGILAVFWVELKKSIVTQKH